MPGVAVGVGLGGGNVEHPPRALLLPVPRLQHGPVGSGAVDPYPLPRRVVSQDLPLPVLVPQPLLAITVPDVESTLIASPERLREDLEANAEKYKVNPFPVPRATGKESVLPEVHHEHHEVLQELNTSQMLPAELDEPSSVPVPVGDPPRFELCSILPERES